MKDHDGPKIVLSDEMKDKAESYPESDKIYFTKQHLKDALKDFRDKFHDDGVKSDGQEISRSEAGFSEISLLFPICYFA